MKLFKRDKPSSDDMQEIEGLYLDSQDDPQAEKYFSQLDALAEIDIGNVVEDAARLEKKVDYIVLSNRRMMELLHRLTDDYDRHKVSLAIATMEQSMSDNEGLLPDETE